MREREERKKINILREHKSPYVTPDKYRMNIGIGIEEEEQKNRRDKIRRRRRDEEEDRRGGREEEYNIIINNSSIIVQYNIIYNMYRV